MAKGYDFVEVVGYHDTYDLINPLPGSAWVENVATRHVDFLSYTYPITHVPAQWLARKTERPYAIAKPFAHGLSVKIRDNNDNVREKFYTLSTKTGVVADLAEGSFAYVHENGLLMLIKVLLKHNPHIPI